jgi:hypothetical protein
MTVVRRPDLPLYRGRKDEVMTTMLKSMLAVALLGAWAQEGGNAPRELTSEKDHWINSAKPLKFADLQGKVVWLEFGVLN